MKKKHQNLKTSQSKNIKKNILATTSIGVKLTCFFQRGLTQKVETQSNGYF